MEKGASNPDTEAVKCYEPPTGKSSKRVWTEPVVTFDTENEAEIEIIPLRKKRGTWMFLFMILNMGSLVHS